MADDDFCYLTTTGRRSGRPHEIEIWYADGPAGPETPGGPGPRTLFLLAGGRDGSDWVRNLAADPACTVRLGTRDATVRHARARILTGADVDDATARSLVFAKYQPRGHGDLSGWREGSLAVALDLHLEPAPDLHQEPAPGPAT